MLERVSLLMEIQELEYEDFGRCIRITNEILDCVVSIETGPRILRFGFIHEQNIFYNDLDHKYTSLDEKSTMPAKNSVYQLYGGHRLQICQTPQVDFPDNAPVVYSTQSEGVTFTPPKLKPEEIQLSFEIIMGEKATDIMIVHSAKNCSRETMVFALFPSTMLAGGGMAVIPQNLQAQEGRPNRTINLWPGTDLKDQRISCGSRFLVIRHESENQAPLRIGTNNLPGWIAYALNGIVLVKRFVSNPQAAYPDSGSTCEIHLTEDFAELSSLSPLYQVKPGETIKHVENLSLYRMDRLPAFQNEDEIEKWMKELLG